MLPYLLTDRRLVRTVGVEDALWLRMLDVPAVLEARSYAADVSVVLDISDPVLGGGGRYALEVHDGKARCVRTDAAADVHTELSVLGSLYMGGHRASAFAPHIGCGAATPEWWLRWMRHSPPTFQPSSGSASNAIRARVPALIAAARAQIAGKLRVSPR